jgi:phosphatidylserine/phosphatidylglycerophosphate/cardiolipin synthase-like enzyme
MADGACAVAPDKPGAISNNYQDPEDPAYTRWFIPNTGDGPENNPPPPREGNLVDYFVWGDDLFAQMAEDLRTAKTSDHFIHLSGFETSPDTSMGGTALKDLLSGAAGSGVSVRGIFNGDNVRRARGLAIKDNKPLHDHIIAIGGSSVLDGRVNFLGAHHQKITAILGEKGLIAYTGGTDLCGNRASRGGWHDVHCRIVGPSAGDVARIFFERWEDQVQQGAQLAPLGMPALPAKQTQCGPTYAVQIARTYPLVSGPGAIGYDPGPPLLYAPRGERKVYEMILNAIRQTTRFIYVEDQFLVCHDDAFVQALQDRLKSESFQYLVILTNTHDRANLALLGHAEYRRKLLGCRS